MNNRKLLLSTLFILLILLLIAYYILNIYTIKEFFTFQRNILIIGSFDFHNECVGFLCEIFNNDNITVCYNNDKYNYIDYYKQLYDIKYVSNYEDIRYDDYQYIIKLTSRDQVIDTLNIESVNLYKNKLISLIHIVEDKDLINNYIILCPYFTLPNTNSEYIFPIYNGLVYESNKNIILYIGDFNEDFLNDDLIYFNNSIKNQYTLVICFYTDKPYL